MATTLAIYKQSRCFNGVTINQTLQARNTLEGFTSGNCWNTSSIQIQIGDSPYFIPDGNFSVFLWQKGADYPSYGLARRPCLENITEAYDRAAVMNGDKIDLLGEKRCSKNLATRYRKAIVGHRIILCVVCTLLCIQFC